MDLERAVEIFSKSRRITESRRVILQAIFKLRRPFSAKDLIEMLPRKGKRSFDLVTLYRNLRAFEEAGIICRTDFSDEMARFMISEPGHNRHHHHVVCRICRRAEAVNSCPLDAQEKVLQKLGFSDIRHRLEFSAICRECAKNRRVSGA